MPVTRPAGKIHVRYTRANHKLKHLFQVQCFHQEKYFIVFYFTCRVIPEGLSKFVEKMAGTFSPVSYRGGSDARKLTCRESAQGSPNLYRGF